MGTKNKKTGSGSANTRVHKASTVTGKKKKTRNMKKGGDNSKGKTEHSTAGLRHLNNQNLPTNGFNAAPRMQQSQYEGKGKNPSAMRKKVGKSVHKTKVSAAANKIYG